MGCHTGVLRHSFAELSPHPFIAPAHLATRTARTAGILFSYGKPFLIRGLYIIQDTVIGEAPDFLLNQDIQTVDLNRYLISTRLIQSQSQLGPSSAESIDNKTQIFTRIDFQEFFYLIFGEIGYTKHT